MARPREFDMSVALRGMMRSFWTNGYEATSVDDLCEASGLSRSSLYSTFGDKHDVLLRSLEHYVDSRIGHIRKVLFHERPLRECLANLAAEIMDDIVAGPGRRGCFIGNCAAEIAQGDREAMALVRHGLTKTEGVFREALTRAQRHGELSPSSDLDAMARFLVAGFQGLRLVGKAKPDRKYLEDITSVIMRCID
jgi:TetR/AcrR family transcriptional repressor of nem operon